MEQILAMIFTAPLLFVLVFGFYHSAHQDDACAYHLRNAYDKIKYIYTHKGHDMWDIHGVYWALIKEYLPKLGYKLEIKSPNHQKHFETIYNGYKKHMADLFVRQRLNFESSHAKLSEFDYYVYTFTQYLRQFMWKERFEDIYLWDGKYWGNDCMSYRIFEKDGKYQLSEFGLAYYKTLYMLEYYLQYQDERICKKKKCIRSVMKLGSYKAELEHLENLMETKTIEKKWIKYF